MGNKRNCRLYGRVCWGRICMGCYKKGKYVGLCRTANTRMHRLKKQNCSKKLEMKEK